MDGAYNFRIIQYANGSVEIRKYSSPVNAIYAGESTIEPIYKKPKKRESQKEYNPFTDEMERLPTFEESERSARNSLNRTKQNIYKYSRQANWEYFITLTFDGAKVDRYDFDICISKVNQWFKNQKRLHAPELKYLYVPEQHKNGAWHIHGVICDIGEMKLTDSGRVAIGKKSYIRTTENANYPTIYNLSGWRFGFSTATKVKDKHKVATYITKYLTKDLCECTFGKKRFYKSRNIPEPEEKGFIVEPHESVDFLQIIENSIGLILVHEKEVTGEHQSVTYRYYQEEREEKENERRKT